MRRNLVAELMSEVCIYGGALATRAEIYDHALTCYRSRGADDRTAHRLADQSSWGYPLASEEDIAGLPTLADMLKQEDALCAPSPSSSP